MNRMKREKESSRKGECMKLTFDAVFIFAQMKGVVN
jgi:hypothetical protein